MDHLTIVFWNIDDRNKAATTFHMHDAKMQPVDLITGDSLCISEFFKKKAISLRSFRKLFPGHIILDNSCKKGVLPSWDSPLRLQSIPMEKNDIQQISKLINMHISVFAYNKKSDEVPRLLFKV